MPSGPKKRAWFHKGLQPAGRPIISPLHKAMPKGQQRTVGSLSRNHTPSLSFSTIISYGYQIMNRCRKRGCSADSSVHCTVPPCLGAPTCRLQGGTQRHLGETPALIIQYNNTKQPGSPPATVRSGTGDTLPTALRGTATASLSAHPQHSRSEQLHAGHQQTTTTAAHLSTLSRTVHHSETGHSSGLAWPKTWCKL